MKAPSPSDKATRTLATRTSVPRIEARHEEKADCRRRTVNRPVCGLDRRPPSPAPLATGRLSCDLSPEDRVAFVRKSKGAAVGLFRRYAPRNRRARREGDQTGGRRWICG